MYWRLIFMNSSRLPVEYKATRSIGTDDLIGPIFFAVVISISATTVLMRLLPLSNEIGEFFFFIGIPISFVLWIKYGRMRLANMQSKMWCQLNEDGIRFCDGKQTQQLRWNDIETGRRTTDLVSEDTAHEVIELKGNGRKIRISGRFFKDEEVLDMAAIIKDKTPSLSNDVHFKLTRLGDY